jgi:DnaJ-class molecular chaperone
MSEHETRDRYSLYRLCACVACDGSGKVLADYVHRGRVTEKCPECRGEGRTRVEVATAQTPEAVGVALVTCAREGEWLDEYGDPCAFGLLDRTPECETCDGGIQRYWEDATVCPDCKGSGVKPTGTWLLLPWLASPRNVRDSARTLARSKKRSGSS